ncbi:hypothetical protein [Pantoea sp. GL120224-02]|uniref:hypothetical protein n=1 Tax=Pantoea sp. GL120224-02 TaxID=1378084 RepID=UPI00114161CC|nr:hypothetical protein [Pantoea sp. GL120224-02]
MRKVSVSGLCNGKKSPPFPFITLRFFKTLNFARPLSLVTPHLPDFPYLHPRRRLAYGAVTARFKAEKRPIKAHICAKWRFQAGIQDDENPIRFTLLRCHGG